MQIKLNVAVCFLKIWRVSESFKRNKDAKMGNTKDSVERLEHKNFNEQQILPEFKHHTVPFHNVDLSEQWSNNHHILTYCIIPSIRNCDKEPDPRSMISENLKIFLKNK